MSVKKNRKQKSKEYEQKYGHIPVEYNERLSWMVDYYKLSPSKMQEILIKRQTMLENLFYYDYNVIELLEEPEGASRPKVRILKSNYNKLAKSDPTMVHIYVPGAGDDRNYMQRLINGNMIDMLDNLIYTPCQIEYNMYIKTPSYFNATDTFLAEIGLIRAPKKPDWDNAGKKYCDMFNYNIWTDDALVIDASVHKYYSILPRVEIKLRYLNALYNKNMYNSIIKSKEYEKINCPLIYLDSKGELKNE